MKRKLYFLPLFLTLLAATSACTTTPRAYKAAGDDPEKIAYVMTKHYTALLREANTLKSTGAFSDEALAKVQAVDRKAVPILVGDPEAVPPKAGLAQVSEAYSNLKSAKTEADLRDAINKAAEVLAEFIDALKGARL